MTGPAENSQFCFPTTSMFPLGPVIKCLLYRQTEHQLRIHIQQHSLESNATGANQTML